MKVWTLTTESESSDRFGPWVFDHNPTEAELKKCIESTGESLNEGGPGAFGSYVYLTVEEVEVNEI